MTKRERLLWELDDAVMAARIVSTDTTYGQGLHKLAVDAEYAARSLLTDEAITEEMISDVVRAVSRFNVSAIRLTRALRDVIEAPKVPKTEGD